MGKAETLELCFLLIHGGGNRAQIVATTCFWDTSSNTSIFKFGQMGSTLLDIINIIRILIDQEPYRYGDYKEAEPLLRFKPSSNRGAYNNHTCHGAISTLNQPMSKVELPS